MRSASLCLHSISAMGERHLLSVDTKAMGVARVMGKVRETEAVMEKEIVVR